MTLFDAYLFIDWSASSKPTSREPRKDAVWIGELVRGSPPAERYRFSGALPHDMGCSINGIAR